MNTDSFDSLRKAAGTDSPGVIRDGDEITARGITASPGIVVGKAFLKDSERLQVPLSTVSPDAVDAEIERFHATLSETREALERVRERIADQMGDEHARIFETHMLILDDVLITDGTDTVIREQKLNAAAAFDQVIGKTITMFSNMEDEYLRERFVDVSDVRRRVLRKLLGTGKSPLDRPTEPSIIVAHDLSPSDTAQLDKRNTLAYATDRGGRTSHVAIMARSQGVPAVVGLDKLFAEVKNGDTIVVDGNTGTVVVNPTQATLDHYSHEIERFHELEEQLLLLTGYPASTLDDKSYILSANIDMPDEVESVIDYGGQGVGLFRTEYFFISKEYLPTEEEQYEMYRSVVEKMGDAPIVFRTIDIGGDKVVSYLHNSPELNPFMGWRGIRFCLTRTDIFKTQLRALYRASAHGEVKIMFPMISQLEEVVKARAICEEVQSELRSEKIKFNENVELGIMIETPSAVLISAELAKEVAFFSIGTNDLIQYTMAVDRGNTKIAHLYQNLHPSIIRLLKQTVDAAKKAGIHVSVCGEMCGDPYSVPLLIGMDIDQFSCSPNVMPEVKRIIRSVTFDECRSLLRRVLKRGTTAEIEGQIEKFFAKVKVPENGTTRKG